VQHGGLHHFWLLTGGEVIYDLGSHLDVCSRPAQHVNLDGLVKRKQPICIYRTQMFVKIVCITLFLYSMNIKIAIIYMQLFLTMTPTEKKTTDWRLTVFFSLLQIN
jgi:hypothetical protein